VVRTLPIQEVLHRCLDELREGTSLVLQAPPGAGKTTTLPLAMLLSRPEWLGDDGVIVVLEPRRLAARAAATRMAEILGEPVGKTVGYRVRFDSKISRDTRIEVVTEGILARRLQQDPGLENVKAVVFDEFHERSLDADLCLALATDVRAALRPDLRLVVMSATLGQVGPACADLLGSSETSAYSESATERKEKKRAPLVASEGRAFPVRTEYVGAPGRGRFDLQNAVVSAVGRALDEHPHADGGDILVFLPGAREINDAVAALRRNEPRVKPELVLPLHGGLSREDQASALKAAPPGSRRVVVSTPIAESSLTIPGVRLVVDSGLRKTPRFDARKGMTRLDVARVSVAFLFRKSRPSPPPRDVLDRGKLKNRGKRFPNHPPRRAERRLPLPRRGKLKNRPPRRSPRARRGRDRRAPRGTTRFFESPLVRFSRRLLFRARGSRDSRDSRLRGARSCRSG
jgi:ATP-dependent helicase HrpB